MSTAAPVEERGKGGTFWALVPVALLGAGVVGVLTLATIATRDPGFALERDYYQKAVHFDRQQAQWAENERLGYRLRAELAEGPSGRELVARVVDRSGAPLRGARVEVEAFANARAADRRTLELVEGDQGVYRAVLGNPRPGVWELRFVVVRAGDRSTETVRLEVPWKASP